MCVTIPGNHLMSLGWSMLFSQEGLINRQQNLSCEPMTYIADLDSEDSSLVTITIKIIWSSYQGSYETS